MSIRDTEIQSTGRLRLLFASSQEFRHGLLPCKHMVEKKLKNAIQNDHQSSLLELSPGELAAHHITDIPKIITDLTIESVSRYFGGNKYRPDNSTIQRIQHCVNEASKLVTPRATYRLYKVLQTIQGEKIILEQGSDVRVPDCFEVSGAQLIGVVIGTLGAGLEEYCRHLAAKSEIYRSTLFDAVGTAMLDLLSEHVSNIISDSCSRYDLSAGPRFAPGIDGYPLEQQRVLFKLADNTSVGVSLNSSAIMVPSKSISFFQTLTKSSGIKGLENKCSRCRMMNCQFRVNHGKTKRWDELR